MLRQRADGDHAARDALQHREPAHEAQRERQRRGRCLLDDIVQPDGTVLPFAIESYRVLIENRGGEVVTEATVKLVVDGERTIATCEGNGPVNALDAALRAALSPSRPWLADVELSDFKVRLLAPQGAGETRGTDAVTRVLVESTDGAGSWTTVGVHGNVVEASWLALVDAVAYAGLREGAPVAAAAG